MLAINDATWPLVIATAASERSLMCGFSNAFNASFRVFRMLSNSLFMIFTKTLKRPFSLVEDLTFAYSKIMSKMSGFWWAYWHPFPKELCIN